MSNNAHRFRQTEVRRAIKSFCAATGTAHSDIRVEIDRRNHFGFCPAAGREADKFESMDIAR